MDTSYLRYKFTASNQIKRFMLSEMYNMKDLRLMTVVK